MISPYRILGLNEDAGAPEVKAAYRRLAMLFHPDRNDSEAANEMMRIVNLAYGALIHEPTPKQAPPQARPPNTATWSAGDDHDPCARILTFGKHKGKTLGQIAREDMQYLVWVQRSFDEDSYPAMIEEITEALLHWVNAVHEDAARVRY